MNLQELYDYKNQLMNDMLTDEYIVKLIDDAEVCNDPSELLYTQIFPYEYIPETVQGGQTFVCCDVDVYKSENKTFLYPILYIWVFSHRSRLRHPEGGVRPDKICAAIAERINGSRYYGLGELSLYSVKRFAPMTDYNGKVMAFYAKDFNVQYNGSKPTPANRKTG